MQYMAIQRQGLSEVHAGLSGLHSVVKFENNQPFSLFVTLPTGPGAELFRGALILSLAYP